MCWYFRHTHQWREREKPGKKSGSRREIYRDRGITRRLNWRGQVRIVNHLYENNSLQFSTIRFIEYQFIDYHTTINQSLFHYNNTNTSLLAAGLVVATPCAPANTNSSIKCNSSTVYQKNPRCKISTVAHVMKKSGYFHQHRNNFHWVKFRTKPRFEALGPSLLGQKSHLEAANHQQALYPVLSEPCRHLGHVSRGKRPAQNRKYAFIQKPFQLGLGAERGFHKVLEGGVGVALLRHPNLFQQSPPFH